ncbi:DNA internalization-related competence protein ComEC/Rec2 [Pseudomonas sp. NPDC078700]|uniref:DNA internalization-related competence protein ComEC/Rec2 n=1 Tax=Pseudomonas sp. NPDC078700 TaxID=3364424 RepID=UPI0037C723FB
MIALIAGLLTLRFIPQLPAPWFLAVCLLCAWLLVLRQRLLLALFLLGFVWACVCAQWALDDRLNPALDGHTLWLQGDVVGLPEQDGKVVRFQLANAVSRRATLPRLLRLSWFGGPPLAAGETWRMAVRLKRPHALVNPQSFDYEVWLLAQGIGGTGTIKAGERIRAGEGVATWRQRLRQRILASPAYGREGAIVALVLGDGSGMSREDWRTLQHTGTVHLMVISGQHIGLLAALLYGLVAALARRGYWPRALPWLPCACLLSFTGAVTYGALAGFDIPVQRACVMVGFMLLWRWRFRHIGLLMPLLSAMLLILVWQPLASLQPGFWLSFGAAGLLMLVFGGRLGRLSGWRSLTRVQWAMTLGLLPLLLGLGLPVSMSGPVINLFAVPLVGLVIVPLALLGTVLLPIPWLGATLLSVAGGLLELLFRSLTFAATALPAWLPSGLPLWAWLLLAIALLLLLLPRGIPGRSLAWLLVLPALFTERPRPPEGRAQVIMFDVGQGSSIVVQTREHALLYDTGARSPGFDIGERVVLPSLRTLGLDRLDRLLISHADNDHSGGALAIQQGISVGQVISGQSAQLPLSLDAEPCVSASWQWDQVRFRTWQWQQATQSNASSCVLMVEAAGERLLLTGDIDAAAEQALVRSGLEVQAQWLLAPHHGSRSSSSQLFVDAVAAHSVLIGRGKHNAYGHPHPTVVQRYQLSGARLYDTVEQGAVMIELGSFVPAQGMRKIPRFWREK